MVEQLVQGKHMCRVSLDTPLRAWPQGTMMKGYKVRIIAIIFSLIIASGPSFAQSDIVGGFGIELGSEMDPSANGAISMSGYPTTSFEGTDSSGIFSSFFAAVTPTTQRVAAILGMSSGDRDEQWCQSTTEQLSRTLSTKYGDPVDNIISVEAFRRGDLYVWRRDGKEISLACRAFGMMGPFYVQVFYTDAALMDDFVSENLTIENGEVNLDDM